MSDAATRATEIALLAGLGLRESDDAAHWSAHKIRRARTCFIFTPGLIVQSCNNFLATGSALLRITEGTKLPN